MQINYATLEHYMKKRGIKTKKSLAEKCGVSERTLVKLKDGSDFHKGTIKRVAAALEVSPEDLQKPIVKPQRTNGWEAEITSERFKVPVSIVELVGVYLFNAVAELAVKRRTELVENWYAEVEALEKAGPVGRDFSLMGVSDYASYAYDEEIDDIELHPLDAKPEEFNDFFFKTVHELGLDLYMLEGKNHLKELDSYAILKNDGFDDFIATLAGLYDNELFSEFAEINIYDGKVSVKDMPAELKSSGNGLERSRWLATCGGRKKLPDYVYYADKIIPVSQAVHIKNELEELNEAFIAMGPDAKANQLEKIESTKERLSEALGNITEESLDILEKAREAVRLDLEYSHWLTRRFSLSVANNEFDPIAEKERLHA